jgi:hypothetical protein
VRLSTNVEDGNTVPAGLLVIEDISEDMENDEEIDKISDKDEEREVVKKTPHGDGKPALQSPKPG